MIGEENQFENTQNPPVDTSEMATATDNSASEQPLTVDSSEEIAGTVGVDLAAMGTAEGTSETASEQSDDAAYYRSMLAEKDNEIQALKSQVEERTGQYMRIAADFDNYRKRAQREREELESQIKCNTVNELLPVVDNFERARSQIKPQTDQETNIHKSYQSVYKLLVECLKRIGVSPMRAEGKEFDPNLHEAVMRHPTDEHPEGTVLEEMQRGYMLGDRVLRHALVKVAAAPEPVVTSEEVSQGSTEG